MMWLHTPFSTVLRSVCMYAVDEYTPCLGVPNKKALLYRYTRGWVPHGVNCVGTSCGDCGLKATSVQVSGWGMCHTSTWE